MMRKLLVTGLAAGLVITSVNIQAEAATPKKINIATEAFAKKAKSGKMTINGLKAGQKVSYYKNKKGIVFEDFLIGNKPGNDSVRSANALAFTNFQEKVPFLKRTISQVNTSDIKAVSRKKIHQIYGKPLYSIRIGIHSEKGYVDFYKNIKIISSDRYNADRTKLVNVVVDRIALLKANDLKSLKKWRNIDKKYGGDQWSLMYLKGSVWKKA
ncbi:hypothetical protein [Macrococcus animalis]|uniref:hypothetical protein n=1 Tax=Macrococcus animalis TaxID=3395467 RepID=UPI0039BFA1CB